MTPDPVDSAYDHGPRTCHRRRRRCRDTAPPPRASRTVHRARTGPRQRQGPPRRGRTPRSQPPDRRPGAQPGSRPRRRPARTRRARPRPRSPRSRSRSSCTSIAENSTRAGGNIPDSMIHAADHRAQRRVRRRHRSAAPRPRSPSRSRRSTAQRTPGLVSDRRRLLGGADDEVDAARGRQGDAQHLHRRARATTCSAGRPSRSASLNIVRRRGVLAESLPGGTAGTYNAGRHRHPRGRPLAEPLSHLPGRLLRPGRPASPTRRPRRRRRSTARPGRNTCSCAGQRPDPPTSWTTPTTPACTSSPPARPAA